MYVINTTPLNCLNQYNRQRFKASDKPILVLVNLLKTIIAKEKHLKKLAEFKGR